MKVKIYSGNDFLVNAEVESMHALPDLAFSASQHYGSGTYTVVEADAFTSDKLSGVDPSKRHFRLETEWLDG